MGTIERETYVTSDVLLEERRCEEEVSSGGLPFCPEVIRPNSLCLVCVTTYTRA